MKNVFIKDAGVIKEVNINKEVLNKVDKGYLEIININSEMVLEVSKLHREIKEIQDNIKTLEDEKEGFKAMLSRGNAGLGVKIASNTAKIKALHKELEEKTETLKELERLEQQQLTELINVSYDEFITSGELLREFRENEKNLLLKLYSHLYQAFETVKQLEGLETEYKETCDLVYNSDMHRKQFVSTFNTLQNIKGVYNNYPQIGQHLNTYGGEKYIQPYIDGLEDAKKNKSVFTMYK